MRVILLFLILLLLSRYSECKRSGGGRRGSSGRSTSFWNRKNNGKKESNGNSRRPAEPDAPVEPVYKAPAKPKPSAPKQEAEIKRTNANSQQNAPPLQQQKPIGWNVDNNQKQHVNPSANAPPPYPGGSQGHPPPYPGGAPGGAYNPQSHPPPYSAAAAPGSAYHPQGPPPPYPGGAPGSGYHPQGPPPPYSAGGYHPQGPPPAYPGGGYPQPGYHPQGQMGGYNHGYPMGGGGYQQQGFGGGGMMGGGMMGGGLFGGNKFGNSGPYGYGVKKSGGFLGTHAFRNVLAGMLIYHVVSGMFKTPYRVYNHYNRPPMEEREEIQLPANVLTLCGENAGSICVPGSIPICTMNNTVLCASAMSSVAPCQSEADKGELCVNSTIPCEGSDDPLCQNKTGANSTMINLPCLTNMTIEGTVNSNVTLPVQDGNRYCVTTMAIPEVPVPIEAVNGTVPVLGNNGTALEGGGEVVTPLTFILNSTTLEPINLSPSMTEEPRDLTTTTPPVA